MLKFDATKSFVKHRKTVFTIDANFEAANGITILQGKSGAGKTTILRMISGILLPDFGKILLDGKALFDSNSKINIPIQARRVGFVFQDYLLFPHFTAAKNIAFGSTGLEKTARDEKVANLLRLFHIEHVANRYPKELSGGEKQRTALARALAGDPKIVLLDEPLSAVDMETRTKLLDEIENAQRSLDIPFIYVTHNNAEAERLSGKRVTICEGTVEEQNA